MIQNKNNSIVFLFALFILGMSCTSEQPYYEIPMIQENGKALITGISKATCENPTPGDNDFTIHVQFATAKPGDVMVSEILKPDENGALTPLSGSKKSLTVDDELKASVTYTLQEAQLEKIGDFIVVTFAGDTDSGIITVTLEEE